MIIFQSRRLQIIVIPIAAGIDTCLVSRIFYRPAECLTYQCSGLRIQPVRPAVSSGTFRINKYGIGQLEITDQLKHSRSLFHRFFLICGLGKKVHAHRNSGCCCTFHVGNELWILHQTSRNRTAVARTNDGKLHSGIFYLIPVDGIVPLGHIDADLRIAGCGLQLLDLRLVRIRQSTCHCAVLGSRIDFVLRLDQQRNIIDRQILDFVFYMHFGLTDRYFVAFDGKQFHIIISGIQITDIDHAVLIQILVVSHAVQTHIKALPGHRRTLIIHDLDTQILFDRSRYQ